MIIMIIYQYNLDQILLEDKVQVILNMGAANAGQKGGIQLKVATLNYSGILKSPYQFYQNEIEQESLSKKTATLFDQYKDKFVFEFGPFDRVWQQDRFSPLYMPTCGVKNNVHLMNQREFNDKWDQMKNAKLAFLEAAYKEWRAKKLLDADPKKMPKIVEMEECFKNLKMFDFLIYKALLEELYTKEDDREELRNNFEKDQDKFQLNSKLYKQNQKRRFTKPFLNQNQKIQLTLKAITNLNLDILFLQEINQRLVEAVEKRPQQFRIVKSSQKLQSQSVIIFRVKGNEAKFPKFKSMIVENTRFTNNISWLKDPNVKASYISEQDMKSLNFNSDTVVQCLYNIILICPHLNSKQGQNRNQTQRLKDKLGFLKQKFPDCHIIVGGDLNNSDVQNIKIQRNQQKYVFNVVPDCLSHLTAHKMRTYLQAQPKKANIKIDEVKDYIISDLKIKQAKVQTVSGTVIYDCSNPFKINYQDKKQSILPLLPSAQHPYDHYMVAATLVIEDSLEHVTDPEYKLKYIPKTLTNEEQVNIHDYENHNMNRREREKERLKKMEPIFDDWWKQRLIEKERKGKKEGDKKK